MAQPALSQMTEQDRRVMFTALSFLAVAAREDASRHDNAARALALAAQVEEFCRLAHPEAFTENAG